MSSLFRTNSFKILALFFLLIIVNTFFSITLIYENQVDLISENARLKAEKMVSSAVLLLENSLSDVNVKKDDYEAIIPEIKRIISPVITSFAVFTNDGHVLFKTSGKFKIPDNYVIDGMKAVTNTAFTGRNYHVNIDDKNLTINFYIPLRKLGIGNLIFYTRHNIGELNDRMRALYIQGSLLIFVALILHLAFAVYFYVSHIRPIFILESESMKIAKGDFSDRIEIQQDNEFGNLAKAFNFMADSIQDRIAGHKEQKEIAEASSLAKSEFLAQMSHEIRTPLNSIHGFIELMKKTGLDSRQEEFLNIISLSANDLLGIINDILDFSKIESRKLEIDEIDFNPLTEFESIISLMTLKATEKNMLVLAYIDPSLTETYTGDPLRIKQVLANLLSNAVKFTPEEGTIKLEIVKKAELDGSSTISFSVSDTGIGISSAKQDKIFTSFAQEDSSISRKFGGTGLGLAISQNLVNLMGGTLKLESNKGRGSRFSFLLDLKTAGYTDYSQDKREDEHLDAKLLVTERSSKQVQDNILKYLQAMNIKAQICTSFNELKDNSENELLIIIYHESLLDECKKYIQQFPDRPVIYLCQRQEFELTENISTAASNILYLPVTPGRLRQSIQHVLKIEGDSADGFGTKEDLKKAVYPGNILLAEDNKVNQMLMKLLLVEFGATVDIASNGITAFDMYAANEYDLIFMDIHMPISDGIESTQMIREYEKKEGKSSAPIVALTARAIKGDRELFLDAGMDGYLSKPVNVEKLEKVLEKYITKQFKETDVSPEIKAGSNTGIIKIGKISERLQLPEEVIWNIIGNFFATSHEDLDKLKEAVENNDYEQMYQSSHKIKGATANLEFQSVYSAALEIEELSNERKEADYQAIFDGLVDNYEKVKTEFENHES